jgi:hypothetical protein
VSRGSRKPSFFDASDFMLPFTFQHFGFLLSLHGLLTFDLSCFPKKLWYSASLRRTCAPLFDILRWERKEKGKAEIHPPPPRLWRTNPPSRGYDGTRRARKRQHPSCTCIVLFLRVARAKGNYDCARISSSRLTSDLRPPTLVRHSLATADPSSFKVV